MPDTLAGAACLRQGTQRAGGALGIQPTAHRVHIGEQRHLPLHAHHRLGTGLHSDLQFSLSQATVHAFQAHVHLRALVPRLLLHVQHLGEGELETGGSDAVPALVYQVQLHRAFYHQLTADELSLHHIQLGSAQQQLLHLSLGGGHAHQVGKEEGFLHHPGNHNVPCR